MRVVTFIAFFIIGIFIGYGIMSIADHTRPLIYITSSTNYAAFDDSTAYEIRYSVNGIACVEFFDSPERRAEYVEYLGLVGELKE
jgi:hypothetical protein